MSQNETTSVKKTFNDWEEKFLDNVSHEEFPSQEWPPSHIDCSSLVSFRERKK